MSDTPISKEEADERARVLLFDMLGLDEFQRVAVADLLRDLKDNEINFPDVTKQELVFLAIGTIISERM